MKNKYFLIVAILFGAISVTSCGKDDNDPKNDPSTGTEQGEINNPTNNTNQNNNSNTDDNDSSNKDNSSNQSDNSFSGETGKIGGIGYVDLGLPSGLLWATCNVGAENPEEIGGFFSWGETKTNTKYSSSTYKFGSSPTKYNKTDGLTVLEAEDDAATANLGNDWRMPTKEECQELLNECAWVWTDNYKNTNVKGRIVYNKNISGKYDVSKNIHIFLPAAGYYGGTTNYDNNFGRYWSATLYDYINPLSGEVLGFVTAETICGGEYYYMTHNARNNGLLIRPVHNK